MKKRILSLLLAAVLSIGLLPGVALAEDNSDAIFDSLTSLGDAPAEYKKNINPYGYQEGEAFMMAAQNELLFINSSSVPDKYYETFKSSGYTGDYEKAAFSKLTASSGSPFASNGSYSSSSHKDYQYIQAVAFDPTGSGRDNYVAYVAYNPKGNNSKGTVVVWVMNASTGTCSAVEEAGYSSDLRGKVEENQANNFFAITAGKYTDGTGETFVTYLPLHDTDYCLVEWQTTVNSKGNISIKAIGRGQSYLHDYYEYYADKSVDHGGIATSDDIANKLCVSLATGDFDGDTIDDLAVLSYINDPTEEYTKLNAGLFSPRLNVVHGGGSGTILERSDVQTAEVRKGASSSSTTRTYMTMTAPSVAAGDVDGDGNDEIIAAGWSMEVEGSINSSGSDSSTVSYELDGGIVAGVYEYVNTLHRLSFEKYTYDDDDEDSIMNKWSTSAVEHRKSDFNKTSKGCVMPQFSTECIAINSASSAEYLFLNGTICTFNDEGEIEHAFTPEYFKHKDTNCGGTNFSLGYIASAAVGVFDDNEVGREQIIISVGLKNDTKNSYMLGMIGGRSYSDTKTSDGQTSYGQAQDFFTTGFDRDNIDYGSGNSYYPIWNKEGAKANAENCVNCLVVAIDRDTDGKVAKYVGKTYAYSDPNIVTVLQAAPYFGVLGEYGADTTYSISTSYTIGQSESKSFSYSVGIAVEAEGPGVSASVSSGYSAGWSNSFEKAYTESYTTTFTAGATNQVVVQRTPVVIYCYEIQDENGNWISVGTEDGVNYGAMQISVPSAPVYSQLTVSQYNTFVDQFNELASSTDIKQTHKLNKISGSYLTENEGDPSKYAKTWTSIKSEENVEKDSVTQLSEDNTLYTTDKGSTTFAFSESTDTTVSNERTSGYYFNASIGTGASFLLGSVYVGLETSVSGDKTYGVYTTEAISKESSGTVYNLGSLSGEFSQDILDQFGFQWQFGTWDLKLDNRNAAVPVFGYKVNSVSRAMSGPTNLTAATDENDKNNVILSWDAVDGATGYTVYDITNGTYTEIGTSDETSYTYDMSNDTKPYYTFVVTATKDRKEGLYSNIVYYYRSTTGLSAYEIAVENGFTGTEEEWLQSLIGADGKDGADGVGIEDIYINHATGELFVVLSDGNIYSLGDVVGEDGTDGLGINEISINENGELVLILSDGTEQNFGVVVGKDGEDGEDGETPYIGENGNWWIGDTDTGVKAGGTDGTNGTDGADGQDGENGADGENGTDGVTPQLRVNDETNEWEVSYDNGETWTSLGVKATVIYNFTDVLSDDYYYDAVMWAVRNGVTTGTSATSFSPDMACTRAQAVTFLWRANGSPEPTAVTMQFTDVNADAYYCKAVLWAVENGITNGTSETTFSPDNTCTRGQIVTMLYRAAGSPAIIGVSLFEDVPVDAYYATAVTWAVENGITNGTSTTKFSPENDCTRAQIVTMLHRSES